MRDPKLVLGPDLVKLIAEIDEFKGRWEALRTLSPDRLNALRKVATIESVGSSTRIEGAKLSDAEVEDLLSRAISIKSFKTRDEQEVAGYAEAMDLVFEIELVEVQKSVGNTDAHGRGGAKEGAAHRERQPNTAVGSHSVRIGT